MYAIRVNMQTVKKAPKIVFFELAYPITQLQSFLKMSSFLTTLTKPLLFVFSLFLEALT